MLYRYTETYLKQKGMRTLETSGLGTEKSYSIPWRGKNGWKIISKKYSENLKEKPRLPENGS